MDELPAIGLTDDVAEDLLRDSITATVNHWHAVKNSTDAKDKVHKHHSETMNELAGDKDEEEENENLLDELFSADNNEENQNKTEQTNEEHQNVENSEGETSTEPTAAESTEATAAEGNEHLTVTTKAVEESSDYEPTEVEVDAFIEFAIQLDKIYSGRLMDVARGRTDDKEAAAARFNREEIKQFLKQIHDLVMRREGEGRREDLEAWKGFLEELRDAPMASNHGRPHHHHNSPYKPTEQEIQTFLDFLKFTHHSEDDADRHPVQTTYSEVMHHLVRIHNLSHLVSVADEFSRRDLLEWLDFVLFMQRLGLTEHGHRKI